MRLQEYWGVGPKTSEVLRSELGVEAAIEAIESEDVRRLTAAGLTRSRATRILRRANGGEGMGVLATRDARAVYKRLLDAASEYAVTESAADRIRVLTPLLSREAIRTRLDAVMEAADSWTDLDDATRDAVVGAFDEYDDAGDGERAAVETALALRDTGATEGSFATVAALDADDLRDAADALARLDGGSVEAGADDELDRLRERLSAVERLEGNSSDLLETLRSGEVHGSDQFQEAFIDHVAGETDVAYDRVRDATPDDASDVTDFVGRSLRALRDDLRTAVDEREEAVAERLEARIDDARGTVDAAVDAVDELGFHLSLARFARAFGLTRPEIVADGRGVAVVEARNLFLAAADAESVQPITYAVGDHDAGGAITPPDGDQVSVLTGANSGGKTTLLETLCQVALLAQMGLPVPATRAQVTVSDTVVFHRRHASFNAGVLESTLRSIVPPLTDGGRALMLVDEFEAITEPGSAADLLHGLVRLTVDEDALGVFVTHLADDLKPLPDRARKDGIFAEGLGEDLELEVDYQPRFGTVGKSTPEFIVSRLLADAGDRTERAGFETLARAVGEEAVQRTLDGWSETVTD